MDANVIVAAFAGRGLCAEVFEVCLKECEIILEDDLINEIESTFQRKIKLPAEKTSSILQFILTQARIIKPNIKEKLVCRDPSDIQVLAAALETKADVIITGDEDLLILKKIGTTAIITPRQFWDLMAGRKKARQKF